MNWPLAAARALSASDGRDDLDAARVLRVGRAPSRFETWLTSFDVRANVDLRRIGRGWNSRSATGSEMNTVESSVESSSTGLRIPTTVNQVLPRYTITCPPTWLICRTLAA